MRVLLGVYDGSAGSGVDKFMDTLLLDMLQAGDEPEVALGGTAGRERFRAMGVPCHTLPPLWRPLARYRAAKRLFSAGQYAALYWNVSTALPFIVPLAAKRAGVLKRVVYGHAAGTHANGLLKRGIICLANRLCAGILHSCATHCRANSSATARWIFPRRAALPPVEVVPCAINPLPFAFNPHTRRRVRGELGIPCGCLALGHVGQLSRVKNQGFLLKVLAVLRRQGCDARLILAGAGQDETLLMARAKRAGLEGYVLFLGYRQDVAGLMQAMDVFLFPSLFEGLGYAALEAQASGLLCLVSRRVPREVKRTPNCYFLPIRGKKAPGVWAGEIKKRLEGFKRRDMSGEV